LPRARQRDGPLLARWEAGYRDPWLSVTDLPPKRAEVAWDGRRAGIEGGFKASTRGGWPWEPTKLTNPRRAERLHPEGTRALASARFWTVSGGGHAEVTSPLPQLTALPERHIARRRATSHLPVRQLSCFRRGRLMIVAARCAGHAVPRGHLLPAPWPKSLDIYAARPSVQKLLRKAA
jgi:hypothetical protein